MAKSVIWDLDYTLSFCALGLELTSIDIFHNELYKWRKKAGDVKPKPLLTIERQYQETLLDKLLRDNLIVKTGTAFVYVPTVEGRVFLYSPPRLWNKRPFKYRSFKDDLTMVWQIVKVIAVSLNALALLYVAYMAWRYPHV
jgi:hypothetical protein